MSDVQDAYRTAFLVALREQAAEEARLDPDAPELVDCAPLGERDVVVLYRERPTGTVLGRRYDLPAFAALFAPSPSARALADIVIWDQLRDPTGRGEVLDVDWADGLGVERRDVEWVGAAQWLEP